MDVNPVQEVKEVILGFLYWQAASGEVPDGYMLGKGVDHTLTFGPCLGEGEVVCKNTVETDQETSLLLAFDTYVGHTKDMAVLEEVIEGVTVMKRLEAALQWVMDHRFDNASGLVFGATTLDWGDCQFEADTKDLRMLDDRSHLAFDVYDNAMMKLAIDAYNNMMRAYLHHNKECPIRGDILQSMQRWSRIATSIRKNVRKVLWDDRTQKYKPHHYINGSPFPSSFKEDMIYFHGGTSVAMLAGFLTKREVLTSYNHMRSNVQAVFAAGGNVTIGLTIYPPYPSNVPGLRPQGHYAYQNGGDWDWFGGRTVLALIKYGFLREAEESLQPMLDRVIAAEGFYEWWDFHNTPQGSSKFHGGAGVVGEAILTVERLRAAMVSASPMNLMETAAAKCWSPNDCPQNWCNYATYQCEDCKSSMACSTLWYCDVPSGKCLSCDVAASQSPPRYPHDCPPPQTPPVQIII